MFSILYLYFLNFCILYFCIFCHDSVDQWPEVFPIPSHDSWRPPRNHTRHSDAPHYDSSWGKLSCKYISKFRQIPFGIWTNTSFNLLPILSLDSRQPSILGPMTRTMTHRGNLLTRMRMLFVQEHCDILRHLHVVVKFCIMAILNCTDARIRVVFNQASKPSLTSSWSGTSIPPQHHLVVHEDNMYTHLYILDAYVPALECLPEYHFRQ